MLDDSGVIAVLFRLQLETPLCGIILGGRDHDFDALAFRRPDSEMGSVSRQHLCADGQATPCRAWRSRTVSVGRGAGLHLLGS